MTADLVEARRCRNLWRAVVLQSICDALHQMPYDAANTRQRRDRDIADLIRAAARRWLLRRNGDFDTVCALADLDADTVRGHAVRLIRSGAAAPQFIQGDIDDIA